ncbi:MAG: hypothetical protein Kow00105_01660 [Phycisphaeraceae bacterium]
MTDMLDDPTAMTPSQRRREIAAIFARGVLRLRQCRENTHDSRPSRTAEPPEETSESGQDYLDEGAKTSPHVPVVPGVVNDRENMKELEQ